MHSTEYYAIIEREHTIQNPTSPAKLALLAQGCPFRGVHKAYLAVYEAIRNAKRITPEIVRRLCFGTRLHTNLR